MSKLSKSVLGDYCKIESGYPFKTASWQANGVPVVKIKNVGDGVVSLEGCSFVSEEVASNASKFYVQEGDVLVSLTGYVGQVGRVQANQEALVNQRVGLVRPFDESELDFLFYFLRASREKIENLATGSAQANVSPLDIMQLEYPDLSDEAKSRITSVLKSLDVKLALNTRQAKLLEQIAQTIFKSWFIDFDPVHAKSLGEQPEGIDAETAALFPDSFEESESGLIPRGWVLASLSQNFSIISGGTPKTNVDAYWNGDIPWYSVADLNSGNAFFVKTSKTITHLGAENSAVNVLEAKTTIISARGTVGKVAMNGVSSTFNQSCYGLQGTEPYFIYCLTKHNVPRLLNITHGGTFDTITRSSFDSIHVPSIPEALKLKFENVVTPIFDQVRNLATQNETLSSIRDSLLPRLISGELEIPEELLVD